MGASDLRERDRRWIGMSAIKSKAAALGRNGVRANRISELVEDIMSRTKRAIGFNEGEISWRAERPELGAVRVGDQAVMQQVDEPADAPFLKLAQSVANDADALGVVG